MAPKFRFVDPEATGEGMRATQARQALVAWAASQVDLSAAAVAEETPPEHLVDRARKAESAWNALDDVKQRDALREAIEAWEGEYVSHQTMKALKEEGAISEPDDVDHDLAMKVLEATLAMAGKRYDVLEKALAKKAPPKEPEPAPAPEVHPDDQVPPEPPGPATATTKKAAPATAKAKS